MARKETIYTVSKETNEILRTSKTFLAALNFSVTLEFDSVYICTSEFELKKGDPMSNITSFL